MSYQVHYWTQAGGCTRDETRLFNNFIEVKQDIAEDIITNPYINLWYGQWIDVFKNEQHCLRIETNCHNGPIQFKWYFDDLVLTSFNAIPDNDDFDMVEYVSDVLFANHSKHTINHDYSQIYLTFEDQHKISMLVTLNIDQV